MSDEEQVDDVFDFLEPDQTGFCKLLKDGFTCHFSAKQFLGQKILEKYAMSHAAWYERSMDVFKV